MSNGDQLDLYAPEKPRSLIHVILGSVQLLVDSTGIARLRRPIDGPDDWAWPIDHEVSIAFISKLAFDHNGTLLNGSELSAIVRVLQGKAFENYRPDAAACDLVERDPVPRAVARLMRGQPHWKGPASKLLTALRAAIADEGIDFHRDKAWPKGPAQLSRRLTQLHQSLEQLGIRHSTRTTARERSHILDRDPHPTTDDGRASLSSPTPSSHNLFDDNRLHADDDNDDRLKKVVESKET